VIDRGIAKDNQSSPAPGTDHGGIAGQDDWFEDGALQIEARIKGPPLAAATARRPIPPPASCG
jgi:hypothetical protein